MQWLSNASQPTHQNHEQPSRESRWQRHPDARPCPSPYTPQISGPTKFHATGGAQTSCIQPQLTFMGFSPICTVKEGPQKSYIRVRRRCAGGCSTVVWAAEVLCRRVTTNYASMGLLSKYPWVTFSNCCSTYIREHTQPGYSCTRIL